jgi:hypothetical protein
MYINKSGRNIIPLRVNYTRVFGRFVDDARDFSTILVKGERLIAHDAIVQNYFAVYYVRQCHNLSSLCFFFLKLYGKNSITKRYKHFNNCGLFERKSSLNQISTAEKPKTLSIKTKKNGELWLAVLVRVAGLGLGRTAPCGHSRL